MKKDKPGKISRRVWGDPIGKTKAGDDIYRSILGHYWVDRGAGS